MVITSGGKLYQLVASCKPSLRIRHVLMGNMASVKVLKTPYAS